MKFKYNGKEVGTSFVEVKRKVKKALNGLTTDKMIQCIFPKGRVLNYKIVTKSVDTKKKKGCMNVKFLLTT